jgi:branched-chain amino acid transport system substrate-binding protein
MQGVCSSIFAGTILLLLQPGTHAHAQDVVTIGVVTDHTGNAAEFARIEEEGLELALKEINAAGGILGKKVKLAYEDDEDKPALSATKVRKLASSGVPLIIQLSSSTSTQQAESASLETKTPHIGANQAADTLITKLDNPYFFLAGMPASIQFKTLLAFTQKKYKTAAIFTDTSAIAQFVAKTFREGAAKAGIKIVSEETIEAGATDAVAQVQHIRSANPEVVLDAGNMISESATFYRTYRRLQLPFPIIANYNKSIPRYLQVVPGLLDGVSFLDCFDQDKPEAKAFIERFKADRKEDPFSLTAFGYNALYLAKDAIERAGSLDREKIREALASTHDFKSVIGATGTTLNFAPDRRAGFPEQGAVIRVIENNRHGKAIFAGY